MKITKKYTYTKSVITEGEEFDEISTEVKHDQNGIEETHVKVVQYRTKNKLYQWSKHSNYLEDVMTALLGNEKMLVPAFLLKCQFIEFGLKFILLHLPYKKDSLDTSKIEGYSMGQTIAKIREQKDSQLSVLMNSAYDLKEIRNEITHNFINSDKTIDQINKLITDNLQKATEIEEDIVKYILFVENTLGIKFEDIK